MSHSRCGILEHRKKTFRRKQHYAALVMFPGSTTKLAISLVRSLRSQVPPLITHNAQKNHHHLDPTHAHTHGEVAISNLSNGFRLTCQCHLPLWFIETLVFRRIAVTLGLPGFRLGLVAISFAGTHLDVSKCINYHPEPSSLGIQLR